MEKESLDYFKRNPVKSEPIVRFRVEYNRARSNTTEPSLWSHNFVLVTVDENNQPHGRTVSMHTFDEMGFYFCTNYDGPKSTQMGQNPKVAMVFNWENIQMEIRVTGTVTKLNDEDSDFLFNRCGKGEKMYYTSCSGGKDHPFSQSKVYTDVKEMSAYKSELNKKYAHIDHAEMTRPASWGGWRISPITIEFNDLTEFKGPCRVKYTKNEGGEWTRQWLSE